MSASGRDDDDEPTPPIYPTARCPHCRKQVRVMPSGLFALHVVVGRWGRSMCRGSGERARV